MRRTHNLAHQRHLRKMQVLKSIEDTPGIPYAILLARLSMSLQCSPHTLKQYISELERCFLVYVENNDTVYAYQKQKRATLQVDGV